MPIFGLSTLSAGDAPGAGSTAFWLGPAGRRRLPYPPARWSARIRSRPTYHVRPFLERRFDARFLRRRVPARALMVTEQVVGHHPAIEEPLSRPPVLQSSQRLGARPERSLHALGALFPCTAPVSRNDLPQGLQRYRWFPAALCPFLTIAASPQYGQLMVTVLVNSAMPDCSTGYGSSLRAGKLSTAATSRIPAIALASQHSTHGGAVPSIPPVSTPATALPTNAGNASAANTLRHGWADFPRPVLCSQRGTATTPRSYRTALRCWQHESTRSAEYDPINARLEHGIPK